MVNLFLINNSAEHTSPVDTSTTIRLSVVLNNFLTHLSILIIYLRLYCCNNIINTIVVYIYDTVSDF